MSSTYDLSILIPSIRTNRWETLLASIESVCKRHTWQVVFIGPFAHQPSLDKYQNVKFIEDFGSPSRAIQKGMLYIDSDLVFVTVDDCILYEDSLDLALDQYHAECGRQDVLLMRYKEGGYVYTPGDYRAGHHQALRIPNVNPDWLVAPQFLMNQHYFKELGGFDCRYEYNNEPVHDFMFRLQMLGNKIVPSNTHVTESTHYPGCTGDHRPIHESQLYHDYPIFVDIYTNGKVQMFIDYDNWKNTPEVWTRRFTNGIQTSYEDLVKAEGYQV